MFIPRHALHRRSSPNQVTTTSAQCQLFTVDSRICVGDLVAGIGCAVAVILFCLWAVHAWRKRYRPAAASSEQHVLDPYHVVVPFNDSLLVKQGVVYPPTKPEKARTNDVFWSPTSQHDVNVPFKLLPPGLSTSPPGPPVTMTVMVHRVGKGAKDRDSMATLVSTGGQTGAGSGGDGDDDDLGMSRYLRTGDAGFLASPSPRSSWVRGEVALLPKGAFGEGESERRVGPEEGADLA
ncbi:hypothetical protein F5I97DRAFT_1398954 [Phlebopus sp. FC_14]|nr:hypothetical protein F5I97DRAFT_1398954 [Phlebopus sp. FC_14]